MSYCHLHCPESRVKSTFASFAILLLAGFSCPAQEFSFGPTLGTYFPWNYGVNRVNDVVITIVSDQGDGERTVGAFVGYGIQENFSLRAALNYFPSSASFIVYNAAEDCAFCPVMKGTLVSRNAVEFFPSASYRLPFFTGEFFLAIVAGPSMHFQFRSKMPDVNFGTMHPGVAEVINAMDSTPKASVLYLAYGFSVGYRRLSLIARLQESPSTSFANDIILDGQHYPFRVKTRYLHLSLSYSFYHVKKKDGS